MRTLIIVLNKNTNYHVLTLIIMLNKNTNYRVK